MVPLSMAQHQRRLANNNSESNKFIQHLGVSMGLVSSILFIAAATSAHAATDDADGCPVLIEKEKIQFLENKLQVASKTTDEKIIDVGDSDDDYVAKPIADKFERALKIKEQFYRSVYEWSHQGTDEGSWEVILLDS